jgi:hypothetical protein
MPTQTFPLGPSSDAGNIEADAYAPTWPPTVGTYSGGAFDGQPTATASAGTPVPLKARGYVEPIHVEITRLGVAVVRFNTAGLSVPLSNVTAAALVATPSVSVGSDATRTLELEWYDPATWPISTAQYTSTASGSANSGVLLTDLAAVVGSTSLALSDPRSHINATGYTALRCHISGGLPEAGGFYSVGLSSLSLVVTYEVPSGSVGGVGIVGTNPQAYDVLGSTSEAKATADVLLAKVADPAHTVTASLPPAWWSVVREGDLIPIFAPGVAIPGDPQSGLWRILRREWKDSSPNLALTLSYVAPIDASNVRRRALHPIPHHNTGLGVDADVRYALRFLARRDGTLTLVDGRSQFAEQARASLEQRVTVLEQP